MNRVFGRAAIESKNTSIDLSGGWGGLINHILRLSKAKLSKARQS